MESGGHRFHSEHLAEELETLEIQEYDNWIISVEKSGYKLYNVIGLEGPNVSTSGLSKERMGQIVTVKG